MIGAHEEEEAASAAAAVCTRHAPALTWPKDTLAPHHDVLPVRLSVGEVLPVQVAVPQLPGAPPAQPPQRILQQRLDVQLLSQVGVRVPPITLGGGCAKAMQQQLSRAKRLLPHEGMDNPKRPQSYRPSGLACMLHRCLCDLLGGLSQSVHVDCQ